MGLAVLQPVAICQSASCQAARPPSEPPLTRQVHIRAPSHQSSAHGLRQGGFDSTQHRVLCFGEGGGGVWDILWEVRHCHRKQIYSEAHKLRSLKTRFNNVVWRCILLDGTLIFKPPIDILEHCCRRFGLACWRPASRLQSHA